MLMSLLGVAINVFKINKIYFSPIICTLAHMEAIG